MLQVRHLNLGQALGLGVLCWLVLWTEASAQRGVLIRQFPNGVTYQEELEDGPAFVTNREMSRRLTHAKKLLEEEDYQNAARYLQSVLDEKEDWFVETPREQKPLAPRPSKAGEGEPEKQTHFQSLKNVAEELVGAMPEAGQRVYDQEFGITADVMLKEAVKAGDAGKLNEIARRFFHTKAGYEAVYRLGLLSADHGEPFAAALQLQRIKVLPEIATRYEPMLSLKLALCWEQAGLPANSLAVLKQLKREAPRGRIRLGRREVALFDQESDARSWLAATLGKAGAGSHAAAEEWTMPRGNPGRNAVSTKASPVGPVAWSRSTIRDEDSSGLSRGQMARMDQTVQKLAEARREDNRLLAVPASRPLIANGMAVFRTMQNVQAVDLRTGETRWKTSQADAVLRPVLSHVNPRPDQFPQPGGRPNNRTPSALEQFLAQRVWRDVTFGTLSCDPQRVYSVEDVGMTDGVHYAINGEADPLSPKTYNKLMAFGLKTGRAEWEAGGLRVTNDDLIGGTFFLGPPLPLGQQLYCLGERNNEISVIVLHAATGKVVWEQRLLSPAMNLKVNRQRRLTGLSPAFGEGVMICPTAAGAVVAVDVSRRMLLWAYKYESDQTEDTMVTNMAMMQGRNFAFLQESIHPEDCWADSVPVVADGRVLLTPNDSQELHCLDLSTGRLQWALPRGDGIYLAGAFDGMAIVVGRKQVRAVRLTDGQNAWPAPVSVSQPAGRGFFADEKYHLPLADGEIATINVKSGRLTARSKLPGGEVAGNLVSAGGRVVFQSVDSVGAFRSLDQINADIQTRLKTNADDAHALALRGAIELHLGDPNQALADLRNAWAIRPAEETRSLLVGTLLEGLRTDYKRYQGQTEELRRLLRTPDERLLFLQQTAAGADDPQTRTMAFSEYLKLAVSFQGTAELKELSSLHHARTDRWIKARIEPLVAKASPEELAQWDQTAARELAASLPNLAPKAQWNLLSSLPSLPSVEAAELEHIQDWRKEDQLIRKVLVLDRLRKSPSDKIASKATLALAEVYLRLDRDGEAFPLIEELGKKWPDEWREDFQALKAPQSPRWSGGKLQGKLQLRRVAVLPELPVEVRSSSPSPFEHWTFAIDQQSPRLLARDENGTARWHFDLRDTSGFFRNPNGFTLFLHGPLGVLSSGTQFTVLDMLNRKHTGTVLWSDVLTDGSVDPEMILRMQRFRQNRIFPGAGPDLDEPLGTVGLVNANAVVYQVGERLTAADPVTGEPLWVRDEIPANSRLFGDDRHLAVVPRPGQTAAIYRVSDGGLVRTLNLPDPANQVAIRGLDVIVKASVKGRAVLECRSLLDDRVRWQQAFPEGTRLHPVGKDELALLALDGKLRIVLLADGTLQLDAALEPDKDLKSFWVLKQTGRYVVLTDRGEEQQAGLGGFPRELTRQTRRVNGLVYAFDRETGKQLWKTRIENQAVEELPPDNSRVIVFNKRLLPQRAVGGFGANNFAVRVLDLRTGELVYEHNRLQNVSPLSITVQPETKSVTVTFYEGVIQIEQVDSPKEPSRS